MGCLLKCIYSNREYCAWSNKAIKLISWDCFPVGNGLISDSFLILCKLICDNWAVKTTNKNLWALLQYTKAIWNLFQTLNFPRYHLWTVIFVAVKLFPNFSKSKAIWLLCSVKNFKLRRQFKWMLWETNIEEYLSFRQIWDGFLILQQTHEIAVSMVKSWYMTILKLSLWELLFLLFSG